MGFKKYTKTAVIGLFLISTAVSGCTVRGGRTTDQGNTPGIQRQGYTGQEDNRTQPQGITDQGYDTGMATPYPVPGLRMGVNPGVNQPATTPIGGPSRPGDAGVPLPVASPAPQTAPDGRQRADAIRNQLKNMQEISDANVVVVGNTALVAFTPRNPSTDADVAKNMVIDRVKQVDPGISNVTCSQSADAMSQVGRLSNDIVNRRPMNEVINDFNQIVKNIAPASR